MQQLNLQEQEKVVFQIRQFGCGGNGGYFFRNLMQMIHGYVRTSATTTYDVLLIDGDRVEAKNLNNQLYTSEDLNDYKVVSMIERYAEHYELSGINGLTKYVTSMDMLHDVFAHKHTEQVIPVLVGMVDNNRTRQLFHQYFHDESVENLIWIDLGIEDTEVIANPTEEEGYRMMQTGFSGQCVVGLKWKGEEILKPVTDVYANILEDDHTSFPGQSCGDLLPSNPQRMMTNQTASHVASLIMNTLFHSKAIFVSEVNFNAQYAHSKPNYLTKEIVMKFESLKSDVEEQKTHDN